MVARHNSDPDPAVIKSVEFFSIELAPLADGRVYVSMSATTVDDEEAQLLTQEIVRDTVASIEDALAVIRMGATPVRNILDRSEVHIPRIKSRRACRRLELTISGQVPGRFTSEGDPSGPLAGETVVFTGKLEISRGIAAEVAAKMGCNVADSVNTSAQQFWWSETKTYVEPWAMRKAQSIARRRT